MRIPFQLHRRIPLLRRPFAQRDRAVAERDEALGRLQGAERRLDAAPAGERARQGAAATGITTFYWHADQAEEQARRLPDFRSYIRAETPREAASLEIGPSYSPILPKKSGYGVTVVDHCSAEELKAKFGGYLGGGSAPLENIEAVDQVWNGGSLAELFPRRTFEAVVSCHSIEHMPDFVSFLQGVSAILADSGRFFLIIPDQRYMMDIFKPVSDLGKILRDHRAGITQHSLDTFVRNSRSAAAIPTDGSATLNWGPVKVADLNMADPGFAADFKAGIDAAEARASGEHYVDTHGNYFTPSSFALLIEELGRLGLTDLKVDLLTRANGAEFLAVLTHRGADEALTQARFREARKFHLLNMLREQREMLAYLAPVLDA